MIAAAIFLDGGQAQAGYVCVSSGGEHAGVTAPSLLLKLEAPACMAGAGEALQVESATDGSHSPSALISLDGNRPRTDRDFGHSGRAGRTARSVSNNGPSNPPVVDVSRFELPPFRLIVRLRPQTDLIHPFFAVFSHFRPPRAR
jgi:hypothetical protein